MVVDLSYCKSDMCYTIWKSDWRIWHMENLQMNNPTSMSRLSGNRKPQIRFWGNRHSGGGNRCHISFRMYAYIFWCKYILKEVMSMTKYREILRLSSLNLSQQNIADSCNVSKKTVKRSGLGGGVILL